MPISFSQWWSSLARHFFLATFAFLAIVALTVCVILYSPREYRSTARLLLRIGHESATLDPTVTVTGDTMTPVHTREDEVETAIGVMHSRLIMEDVVDQMGAEQILSEKPPLASSEFAAEDTPGRLSMLTSAVKSKLRSIDPVSDRETAIRSLENGFSISAPSKSSLVTVQYQAKHPAVAQNLVTAWVDSYLSHHAKVNRTQGTYEFFLEQDVELKEQLDAAHHSVREAKSNAGFATLEGHQKLLEAQLQTVRSDLLKTQADLVEAAARIDSFADLLSGGVEKMTTEEVSGIASEAHDQMRSLLFQLEVLENEYAARYKDSHPKLVAIREQLAKATEIVEAQQHERKEFRQSINPTHQRVVENRIVDIALREALTQKMKTLLKQQSDLQDEINGLNKHEEELAGLTRNVEVLEERHKFHSVLLEQARLNEVLGESRITSINVVQPASFEERPVSPDKKLCAAAGLFAACAVAMGLPVLLDARKLQMTRYASSMTTAESRAPADTDIPPVSGPSSQRVGLAPEFEHDSEAVLPSESPLETASRPR